MSLPALRILSQSLASKIAIPIRSKTGKAGPAKIDYELRKLMLGDDDARFRTRRNDSEIEAENIMKKPTDFSKDDRITVPVQDDLTKVSGVPEEHQTTRRVRIFIPAKPATQSGTHGTHRWRVEFDNRERWENPLMGWASTGDPLSNSTIDFESMQAAEDYCKRHGWNYYIDMPHSTKLRIKSYGANFSWDKRTRVGSK